MRKVILFALVGIALSIATYGVYETQSRKQTMSDILLANIEAISQGETNDGECQGPSIYVEVFTTHGSLTERVHYDYYTDKVTDINVLICEAYGNIENGKSGANYTWYTRGIQRYETCQGFEKHVKYDF